MKTRAKLHQFHTENLRSVNAALKRVAASTRHAIASDNASDILTFTRLYVTLLGVWAECRLAKLLFQPNAYSDADCQAVRSEDAHLDRWHKVVELAFRKHYGIPKASLSSGILQHSAHARYDTLRSLLNDELRYIITLRNKLAHGQWVYPLNRNGADIAQDQMDALRTENLFSLQCKRKIIDALLNMIADLALSLPTFERDFDSHYKCITDAQRDLSTRCFDSYASCLKAKYERGKQKRRTA